MSKMGQYFFKLCEDAENMEIGDFVKENGQQHLVLYLEVKKECLEEYDEEI
tara:strand:+ start:37 stop:189 length:153 start_codon:yes stop_codon:yes gene_type:complete